MGTLTAGLSRREIRPRSLGAFALAVCCVLGAIGFRYVIDVLLGPGHAITAPFYPAVLFATLFGGLEAGVFAGITCLAYIWWAVILPDSSNTRMINLAVYTLFLATIVFASNHYRDLKLRADALAAEAEDLARQARDSEARRSAILDQLPVAVGLIDRDGRWIVNNSKMRSFAPGAVPSRDPQRMERWQTVDADGKPVDASQWPSSRALRGETVAPGTEFIFTGDDGTQVWTRVAAAPFTNTAGAMEGAVIVVEDIDQLKRAEEQVRLIAHELEHRTKNILAKVASIIRLTRADTVSDCVQAIQSRVEALARTHTLLSSKRWQGAEVKRLIDDEIGAYATGSEERIHVSGPRFMLSATGAESFGMVMHELATNALKYGALSRPGGRLTVEWSQPEKEELVVDWIESGIPLDPAPTHTGFGTRLINLIVERQLAGKVDFDWQNDGLHCRIAVPAEPLRPQA